MIFRGVNVSRISIDESNQIVEAMRKNNRDVTYVVYMDKLGRMEEFLAEHLDGRFQP